MITHSLLGIMHFYCIRRCILFLLSMGVICFTAKIYSSHFYSVCAPNCYRWAKVWKINPFSKNTRRQSVFYFVWCGISCLQKSNWISEYTDCHHTDEYDEKNVWCSFKIMNLISELLKINEHILCMWLALFVDTFHPCHSPYLIIFISLPFLLSIYHYSAIFHSLALITNSMHNVQRTITLSLSLNIVLVSCSCHIFSLSKFIQWMKPGHCVLFRSMTENL